MLLFIFRRLCQTVPQASKTFFWAFCLILLSRPCFSRQKNGKKSSKRYLPFQKNGLLLENHKKRGYFHLLSAVQSAQAHSRSLQSFLLSWWDNKNKKDPMTRKFRYLSMRRGREPGYSFISFIPVMTTTDPSSHNRLGGSFTTRNGPEH